MVSGYPFVTRCSAGPGCVACMRRIEDTLRSGDATCESCCGQTVYAVRAVHPDYKVANRIAIWEAFSKSLRWVGKRARKRDAETITYRDCIGR